MTADDHRKVFRRVPIVFDREIHVSVVDTPQDGTYVDLREFIPSLEQYGRGITFSQKHFPEVMGGLDEAYRDLGYEPGLDEDQSMEFQRAEEDSDGE